MVSVDTQEALKAFKEVLRAESRCNIAEKELSSAILFVPESEKGYYFAESEKLRKIWEGS